MVNSFRNAWTRPPLLTAADVDRLAKICGMLASPFDNERATAASAATKFLRERNLQWADVLRAAGPTEIAVEPTRETNEEGKFDDLSDNWLAAVEFCLFSGVKLSNFAFDFCTNLSFYPSCPTEKQLEILHNIVKRVIRLRGRS